MGGHFKRAELDFENSADEVHEQLKKANKSLSPKTIQVMRLGGPCCSLMRLSDSPIAACSPLKTCRMMHQLVEALPLVAFLGLPTVASQAGGRVSTSRLAELGSVKSGLANKGQQQLKHRSTAAPLATRHRTRRTISDATDQAWVH